MSKLMFEKVLPEVKECILIKRANGFFEGEPYFEVTARIDLPSAKLVTFKMLRDEELNEIINKIVYIKKETKKERKYFYKQMLDKMRDEICVWISMESDEGKLIHIGKIFQDKIEVPGVLDRDTYLEFAGVQKTTF